MLGIKESLDRMTKASSMRWYGHVLGKEDKNAIAKALKFEVSDSKGRGRPKQTWKKQVGNKMKKNRLVKEDAGDRTKWRGVVKTMTIRNPANSSTGTIPDPTCDDDVAVWLESIWTYKNADEKNILFLEEKRTKTDKREKKRILGKFTFSHAEKTTKLRKNRVNQRVYVTLMMFSR